MGQNLKMRTVYKTVPKADGILFDNTRYKRAASEHDLPNFESRNLDSQYWIFWPREAASKGVGKGVDHNLVKGWDRRRFFS